MPTVNFQPNSNKMLHIYCGFVVEQEGIPVSMKLPQPDPQRACNSMDQLTKSLHDHANGSLVVLVLTLQYLESSILSNIQLISLIHPVPTFVLGLVLSGLLFFPLHVLLALEKKYFLVQKLLA